MYKCQPINYLFRKGLKLGKEVKLRHTPQAEKFVEIAVRV